MRWLYSFLVPLAAPGPNVDLVHTTIAGFPGIAGIVAKGDRGTPFLVTEHGARFTWRGIERDPAKLRAGVDALRSLRGATGPYR